MICTAVIPTSVEEAVSLVAGLDLVEMRMEQMALTQADVVRIFACDAKMVATCREGGVNDGARQQVLSWAIDAGAAYVDIEVETSAAFRVPLVEQAQRKGCRVIISYHNFEETPDRPALDRMVAACFAAGADIAKVACMTRTTQDAARLLGLLDTDRPVIALGMGELGAITRMAGPLLGSPFTFAPVAEGKETAPGQLSRPSLEAMYSLFRDR